MARLPLPDLEKFDRKQPYSSAQIQHAFLQLGVDYEASPKEAVTHCIFHNDTGKPNLYVNLREKPGVYHCFACGARGTFDEYVRVKTSWTLVKVLQFLIDIRRNVAYEAPPERALPEPITERELSKYAFRHPYCYERNLVEATLQRYEIGYDREDESITIPWYDLNKKLVTIKRRSVLSKRYTYPENVDLRPVLFGMQHVKKDQYVWIVEAEFDAMYMDQCFRTGHFDQHSAVGLGGTTLHKDAFIALCKRQPKQIVLLTDMDDPGRAAANTIMRQIIEYVSVAVPTYSSKDPNELPYAEVVQLARLIEGDNP